MRLATTADARLVVVTGDRLVDVTDALGLGSAAHPVPAGGPLLALLELLEHADIAALRERGEPTIPTTIGVEKATNPFLRADVPEVQAAVGMAGADPVAVFAEIRGRKDRF